MGGVADDKLREGRAAYAAGRYEDAVKAFTAALDDSALEVDELPKIHSNRCACYLQLKQLDKAVDDAESCTSLKPGWAKGWSRLGTAKMAQYKYLEAAAAFDKATEVAESSADRTQYRNEAAKARQASERTSQYYAHRAQFASTASPSYRYGGKIADQGQLFCRILALANMVRYLVSWDAVGVQSTYRSVVKFILFGSVVHCYRAHGMPQFNRAYAQRIVTDPLAQRVFGAFVLLMGSSLACLLPLIYVEVALLAAQLITKVPPQYRLRIIAKCEDILLAGDGSLSPNVLTNAAFFECGAGLALLFELLTPKRNFMLVVLYWQYLQMRYMLESASGPGALISAFAKLDSKIAPLVARSSITQLAYSKVKQFAKHQVSIPEPGQKPGLKCTIM